MTELRQGLPGDIQAEAHITFLPPRPLWLSADAVSERIRQVLGDIEPFELELGGVQAFPETNMLYLAIEAGHKELLHLHRALNTGELFAEELFEYIPHITLSGPMATTELTHALKKAERAWKSTNFCSRFTVDEGVLLWQPEAGSDKNWTRVSSFPLLPSAKNASAFSGD